MFEHNDGLVQDLWLVYNDKIVSLQVTNNIIGDMNP